MSKTAQPATRPTATPGGRETTAHGSNTRREFLVSAGTMSWQLALVVLVPLYAGSRLDQRLHSSPVWTLIGFVVAMIGTAVVVGYQLKRLTPPPAGGDK